jgi:hypothetical protein
MQSCRVTAPGISTSLHPLKGQYLEMFFFYLFLPINLGYKSKEIENFEFRPKFVDIWQFLKFFRSLVHFPKAQNEFFLYKVS